MAHAALFIVPRAFPHKDYGGASLDDRAEMLRRITETHPRLGAGISNGGLFIDVARETRVHHPAAELFILCGRDAAERMITWDYGDAQAVERMLDEFHLLVAPRAGDYQAPQHLEHAVHRIAIDGFEEYSSTLARETIAAGGDWRLLVPDQIAEMIGRIYR